MILIVFWHANGGYFPRLLNYISTFALPVFFFVSGYLASSKTLDGTLSQFVSKYLRNLVWPYFFFGLSTYLIWCLKNSVLPGHRFAHSGYFRPLIGLVYGVDGPQAWLVHNRGLWFLACLTVTHCLYLILWKLTRDAMYALVGSLVMFVLGFLLLDILHFRLPWNIEIAMIAVLFYALGYLFNVRRISELLPTGKLWMIAVTMVLLLVLAMVPHPVRVDFNEAAFGQPIGFLSNALIGIIVCFGLSTLVPPSSLISAIGENTLIILVLHGIPISIVETLIRKLAGEYTEAVLSSPFYATAIVIFAVAFCLLLAGPIRKWMPWSLSYVVPTVSPPRACKSA
jgi:fucose 4-O-acetylase-like acetyltransferase